MSCDLFSFHNAVGIGKQWNLSCIVIQNIKFCHIKCLTGNVLIQGL
jgi:hypothetical protein